MLFWKFQASKIFIYIRSSLWFVPTLLTLGALALATLLIEVDVRMYEDIRQHLPQLLITEPEGAHSMLSAIATSMATVAGVVFSITIVALAMASGQYSPRVLRNFMRDPANQIVLGVFVGVYIYCLVVLKTISGGDGNVFVPSIAVLVGLLSAIVSIGFFIFFIHHISTAIQASEIAAAITHETLTAIDHLYPNQAGSQPEEPAYPDILPNAGWQSIPCQQLGYIQNVDGNALFHFACQQKSIVRMEHGIGDFVGPGQTLVSLLHTASPDEKTIVKINQIFAIGTYRTIDQDIAFGIRQLVDISLKALSPSVNDTTTAVTCVEHLTVLLSRCAQRQISVPHLHEKGELRVISQNPMFSDLLSLAYRQILDEALANAEMIAQLFRSIDRVAQSTTHPPYLAELNKWAHLIEEASRGRFSNHHAQRRVEEQFRNVQVTFSQKNAKPAF